MNTHSIRGKSQATPILTLAPKFYAKVKSCYPEAVTLMLAKFKQDYKRLTGKTIALDHEQQSELLKLAGADKYGMWKSKFNDLDQHTTKVTNCFVDGVIRSVSMDLEESLELGQHYYQMLDTVYLDKKISESPSM